jgi:hypothetical protein
VLLSRILFLLSVFYFEILRCLSCMIEMFLSCYTENSNNVNVKTLKAEIDLLIYLKYIIFIVL